MYQVGIYVRVSTPGQASEGYSIQDQEQLCRERLDRAFGPGNYQARVFSDAGFSGKLGFGRPGSSKKAIRPALTELVAAIDRGEIDTVVIYRLDRLSRSARVWLAFLQDYIIQHQVDLISLTDAIDTTSPSGRFAASMLALAAELFADITAENVKVAMKRRRADGYPTGQVGFGWKRDNKEDENVNN